MLKHRTLSRLLVPIVTLAVLALILPAGVALAAAISATGTGGVASGTVGTTLTVVGSAFPAGAGNLYFAYGTSYQSVYTVTANSTGGFSTSIQIPTVPANPNYQILVAVGTTSASASFAVLPSITTTTTNPQVGDQIAIQGSGFTANAAVTLRYDSALMTSATANVYGSFGPVYFTVPASPNAIVHSISATDTNGYSASTTYTVQTTLKVTPNSGSVGDTVTISGNGFVAYHSVTVMFDTIALSTVPTTDANGSFTTTFIVPSTTSRSVSVSASDAVVSAYATFSLVSVVRLSPTSGAVGTSVTATGSAFGGSRTVTITLDSSQVATGSSDSVGAFTIAFVMPAAIGGAHSVVASDSTYSASNTFTVSPQVAVNPKNGSVGTQVTVNGTGFGGNKSLTVVFDNSQAATATTDGSGSFSASFGVPASAAGNHNVSAADGVNTAAGQFATTASGSLNPKTGPTGTQVSISGSGFKAASAITIRFNNTQVKTTTTDGTGSYNDKFVVPDIDAGNYSVVASDGTNAATINFAITASMRLDSTTGNVGSPVTVTGTGFTGTVTIKYDGATVATTTADVNGAFTATFNAPVSLHGNHNIVASDASTTLQRSFTMDSTAPPTPQLLTPVTNSVQNARPTFTWTGVTDPSSASYTLQVATDPSFANIVLQKQGLSAAQYKVQGAESLKATGKDSPYYWRVRATDQASNESAFSSPNSFSVSVFPAWALWLLVSIGALIVLLVVLYIGVRMGRRTTD